MRIWDSNKSAIASGIVLLISVAVACDGAQSHSTTWVPSNPLVGGGGRQDSGAPIIDPVEGSIEELKDYAGGAIGIDTDGNPHIFFQSTSNEKFIEVFWNGTGYERRLIDENNRVNKSMDVDFDPMGRPFVCFLEEPTSDPSNNAAIRYPVGDEFKISEIVAVKDPCSISVDTAGDMHVIYRFMDMGLTAVVLTKYDGTSWESPRGTEANALDYKVRTDTEDRPYLVIGADNGLLLARELGGELQNPPANIDVPMTPASVPLVEAVMDGDDLHIAYVMLSQTGNAVKYTVLKAEDTYAVGNVQTVLSAGVTTKTDVGFDVDSNGRSHMVITTENDSLTLYLRENEEWSVSKSYPADATNASVAVDLQDRVHLVAAGTAGDTYYFVEEI